MAQPEKSPLWATDTTYSSGPFTGQPTKVEPSAGLRASGYVPGTKLPFPRLNFWMNLVGQYVDGLADLAALNWGPSIVANAVQPFTNGKLVQVGEWLIGPLNTTVARSFDLTTWTDGSGSYGGAGALVDLATDGTTLLAVDQGSTVTKTTNMGNSWSSAGSLPNLSSNNYHKVGTFNGVWCALTMDKIATDTDLAGTWTAQTVPAGWAGIQPRAVKASPSELLVLPDVSSPRTVLRSTNGSTFVEAGTIAATTVLADFAYSAVKNQWLAVSVLGDCYISSNGGQSWTLVSTLALDTTVTAVAAFGRNWVIACADRLWVTRDCLTARKVLQTAPGASFWSRLMRFTSGTGANAIERLVVSTGDSGDLRIRASLWLG
jgi:hypothetical protein